MPASLSRKPVGPIERACYAYGEAYGRAPWAVAVPVACLLAFCCAGLHRIHYNDKTLERIWSVQGGRLSDEMDYVDAHHRTEWEQVYHTVVFAQRNGDELGKGGDVLTSEALEDMLTAYQAFYNLQVTTSSGKTYGAMDLCQRGVLPDLPGNASKLVEWSQLGCSPTSTDATCVQLLYGGNPSAKFPCLVQGPLECFSEVIDYHDTVYKQLYDPVLTALIPASSLPMPYTGRPSFRSMTPAQIRTETLSTPRPPFQRLGCPWWTAIAIHTPDLWWSRSGEAASLNFFMDGPARIKFRLSLSRPDLADQAAIVEALNLFDEKFENEINKLGERATATRFAALADKSTRRLSDRLEEIPWVRLGVSIGLSVLFVNLCFAWFFKPFHSRLDVAMMGFNLVGFSVASAAGLTSWFNIGINPAMIQTLPFLAIGLGVDDLFVLITLFDELGVPTLLQADRSKVLAAVMSAAGPSVTLSSFCNIAAFSCGMFLKVPALTDCCVAAAFIAGINWLVMLGIFPSCLLLESWRLRTRRPEFLHLHVNLVHRRQIRRDLAECEREPENSVEKRVLGFMDRVCMPFLNKLPVKLTVALMACGLVAACTYSAVTLENGIDIYEICADGSQMQWFFKANFHHFDYNDAKIIVKDVDYPAQQRDLIELHDRVLNLRFAKPFAVDPWWTNLYLTVAGMAAAPLDSATLAATGLPAGTTFAALGFGVNASLYSDPRWAPNGIMTSNAATWYTQYSMFSTLPVANPAEVYAPGAPNPPVFFLGDASYAPEFSRRDNSLPASPSNPLVFTFSRFLAVDLVSTQDFVDASDAIRAEIDKSALRGKAFPYGPNFILWEIFGVLVGIFWRSLGIDLAIICVLTLLFTLSIRSALVTVLSCGMIVIEVFGICALFVKFNVYFATALLITVGLSIEFTAHIIVAFEHATGTVQQRLSAIVTILKPVLLGALSTFVSILPILFADLEFMRKYFASTFCVVFGVGLLNAMVILPAFLALVGGSRGAGDDETGAGEGGTDLPNMLSRSGSTKDAEAKVVVV